MARYLPTKGLLIQHIPRCAGTWVEQVIQQSKIPCIRWTKKQPENIPAKHAMLPHYFREQMLRVQMIAIFVRHPISYYESVWKWIASQNGSLRDQWTWHPFDRAWALYREVEGGTFSDWMFLMLQKEPSWYTRLVEQYVGPEGGEWVDFIGRVESIRSDLLALMTRVGYGKQLEQAGLFKSHPPENSRDADLVWGSGQVSQIETTERRIIERFYDGDNQWR